jgi:WD40 repeat protein
MKYSLLHTIGDCHRDSVNCLSFSPDGCFLASGGDDCAIFLFDYQKGKDVRQVISQSGVTSILWIQIDGRLWLLVGHASGNIQRLDPVRYFVGFNIVAILTNVNPVV